MIDILYLAHNRLEFTKASLKALVDNTNWDLVAKLIIYDDDSVDGTRDWLARQRERFSFGSVLRAGTYGSPVQIMIDYLAEVSPHDRIPFAKIDSDTMVPPGWLDECARIMKAHQELDLLGIEAFNEVVYGFVPHRSYRPATHIGGIGLMRSSAFVTVPRPNGRFGFTAWQEQNPTVVKGWINPSLPVFLLDRLPREPWQTLSDEYAAKGWQRKWGLYTEDYKPLWSWWTE
jgi:hypothetical protein